MVHTLFNRLRSIQQQLYPYLEEILDPLTEKGYSRLLGHVPIIDPNMHRKTVIPWESTQTV